MERPSNSLEYVECRTSPDRPRNLPKPVPEPLNCLWSSFESAWNFDVLNPSKTLCVPLEHCWNATKPPGITQKPLETPWNPTERPWNFKKSLRTPQKSSGTPLKLPWNSLQHPWNPWKSFGTPLQPLWCSRITLKYTWNILENTWNSLETLGTLLKSLAMAHATETHFNISKHPGTSLKLLKTYWTSLKSPGVPETLLKRTEISSIPLENPRNALKISEKS